MMDLVLAWWPVMLAAVVAVVLVLGLAVISVARSRKTPGGKAGASPSRPRKKGKGPSDDELDTLAAWEPVATRVLTSAEREAYHVLRKALPEHVILAQIPLARFIKVPTRNSYSEWLRRVGSLCADLLVCDMASQVVAVVEVRKGSAHEKESTQKRHARMDRVLAAARIPVHVWLEGSLPGPAVAKEAVLGAALATSGRSGYQNASVARRSAEAAGMVASMQGGSAAQQGADSMNAAEMHGVMINESPLDFNVDEFVDDEADAADGERKEPPPSTWFDDLETTPAPLDTAVSHSR